MLSKDILLNAAERFGTPLYVYDEAQIKFQYASLKQAFRRSDVKIFYACKALTNVNILKILEQQGAGIDCVSINEVQLALKAGFTADRIIFTPNSVAFDEYLEATALHVNINIDNLSLLEEFGHHFGDGYPVIIRLNPHIMAGGNIKISTGHVDSKFGISIEQVQEIRDVMERTKLSVKGLHIHTGSEIKDLEVFVKGLELVLETTQYFPDLSIIDLGGGFKVPYKPDEVGTDMEALGEKLADTFEAFEKTTGKKFQVWFELRQIPGQPGRLFFGSRQHHQAGAFKNVCWGKQWIQSLDPANVLRCLPQDHKHIPSRRGAEDLQHCRKHLRDRYFCLGQGTQ